jgi:hypothetical protein
VFHAHIELVDVESEINTNDRTCDLSLFGCHVEPTRSWSLGTEVRLKITHKGAIFTAFGRIANVRRNGSVGVEFIDVADKDQLVLEKWMAELREEAGQHSKIS